MTSLEVWFDPKATPLATAAAELTADSQLQDGVRWDAWLAKGRVRDRRMLRRMGWVAGLIVVALVSWVWWSLAR